MSGNFVRERQRIVCIYNIIYVNNTLPLAHEISRHFWAAYGLTAICVGPCSVQARLANETEPFVQFHAINPVNSATQSKQLIVHHFE